jgi:hypothetical protein
MFYKYNQPRSERGGIRIHDLFLLSSLYGYKYVIEYQVN